VVRLTLEEARQAVVLAGRKLVESGLIARTWGNVSCRVDDNRFAITPSGRDYLTLKPEEIVEVSISDLSYSGSIKPSSEKGIHAEVYKLRPDINFVIHTHQDYASAASVLDTDSIPVSAGYPALGSEVPCAAYALPGTKKLRRNVVAALARTTGNAVIMKSHGALCFGRDCDETFKTAQELEKACEEFITGRYIEISGSDDKGLARIGEFALSRLSGKQVKVGVQGGFSRIESERTETGFSIKSDGQSFDMTLDKPADPGSYPAQLSNAAEIHREIYRKHKGINNIVHADTPAILSVSCADMEARPLLDDFAQIAGTHVKNVEETPEAVSSALKKASAVFIKDRGAICCGPTKGDATAVAMVMEKNCLALISAGLFGEARYINPFECMLMRFVYLKKYSKEAYI